MTTPTDQETEDLIESLIDKHTLSGVLDVLSGLCYAKAAHLQSNWQDRVAARGWIAMAKRLSTVEYHASQRGL